MAVGDVVLYVSKDQDGRIDTEDTYGLFVVKSDTPGVDQEFMTDDLDKAKRHFETSGCTIVHWKGPGKSNRVVDPFGLIFNVWLEEKK